LRERLPRALPPKGSIRSGANLIACRVPSRTLLIPFHVSYKAEQAIALLERPDHPKVKLLLDGSSLSIEPRQAIVRLRRNEYTICWKSKRVKWIRLESRPSKWQECWRTTKAAVLEPGLEWGRADGWDR
jgi:hypothetical protein